MEEMQKAFNKTIIKLQNTSRIAEEQVRNISPELSFGSTPMSSNGSVTWSDARLDSLKLLT